LERITAVSGEWPNPTDARSLLHAYVSCLSFSDLCVAIEQCLDAPVVVRLALRGRLLRLFGEKLSDEERGHLISLVERTTIIADASVRVRQTVDALHSALIGHMPLPTQHAVLERWVDRGTRGSMARWLRAVRDNPSLFDAVVALAYWQASRDPRAAKSLAYQASPEALRPIISELANHCGEGWIVSKAFLRACCDDEEALDIVRSKHPATYLYLCAKLKLPLSNDDAFELVWACPGIAIEGDRGLAIWAIGQMGRVEVLDRIRDSAEMLFEKDMAELHMRYR